VSPQLIRAIAKSKADVIAFHPLLYHPTVVGVQQAKGRVVVHPAAHDEPILGLPLYRNVLARAGGLAYWTNPEQRLVDGRFAVAEKPAVVVGLGVDAGAGSADDARHALGLEGAYLLCLGRVDDGKGARLLVECFARYKARRPGPLRLVFAGPIAQAPPSHPDVVVAGPVAESVKWGLLRGAFALVSPSAFESFSIVLMEAWTVATPALVNSRSPVMLDHAQRSGGALAFGSYAEFEVELDRLTAQPDLRTALGRAGGAYVDRHYRWPDVVDRYARFLTRLTARLPGRR
jgi:glycosyltransferase involved in cell wall biosynthesis